MTDGELAERVGCSRSMISKIRSGKTMPSLGLALAISRVTGVPVETLAANAAEQEVARPHMPEPAE